MSNYELQKRAAARREPFVIRHSTFVLCILLITGCKNTETRFDIISFHESGSPERMTERFERGSFSQDANHNWTFVFEIAPMWLDGGQPPSADATDESRGPAATSQPGDDKPAHRRTLYTDRDSRMSQMIQLQVFWKPRPGTTYAESSQTNASIVYCLITGGDAITYEGAGFVYFTVSRDGKKIEGRIESSTLYPVRYVGEPADLFGPCHLQGTFTAVEDRKHVVSVVQRMRKKLGPPTNLGGSKPPSSVMP
jgi:hypothetical protein